VVTGIGRTGVVGVIKGKSEHVRPHQVGLRADMDALPIHEETGLDLCLEDRWRDACLRP
jgi:metal-dependent amidase/aminoacylase/carboxypeptidase family protein